MTEVRAVYNISKVNTVRKETLLCFPNWQSPTVEELKYVISILGFTGIEVANLVGAKVQLKKGSALSNRSRTVARWLELGVHKEDKELSIIPYAAWAILCHKAGYGCIWENS